MNKNYWEIPDNKLALEIKNLNKFYDGDTKNNALNNVSLNIPAGSIFGLLGPNGAGKSTLINIISGAVIKSSGQVIVWGYDIDKYRKQSKLAIGVVPQELNIDAFFTPQETLNLHSGMFNVPKKSWRTDELLKLMDLSKNEKIEIIGLNYKDKKRNAENFLNELGDPYQEIIFDKEGINAIEWGAFGVPESFLINDGKVIKKYIGPLNKELVKEIQLLIK